MLARRAEAMALSRLEIGKLDVEALFDEGVGHLDMLKQWIRVVGPALKRTRARMNPVAFPGKRGYTDLVPRGVVGVIAPWNFPVAGLYRAVYPALLCGNGVVVKPSEYTPMTTKWLVDSLAAELPPGLAATIQGDAAQGEALIDAGIDACAFTGSPRSGRAVTVRCAERGIPSSIEMGGNDAAIVLGDCDLDRTIAGITHWALSNAGQSCGAIEVALVEEHVADELVARLASAWTRLQVGPAPYADISPLGNRRQFDLVVEHVADAVAKGARLVCGGTPTGTGLFFPPTILDHCTEDMKVVRDETFGPVLAVVRVDGAADAIRRVNRSRYGLGASIWSRDIARAEGAREAARRRDRFDQQPLVHRGGRRAAVDRLARHRVRRRQQRARARHVRAAQGDRRRRIDAARPVLDAMGPRRVRVRHAPVRGAAHEAGARVEAAVPRAEAREHDPRVLLALSADQSASAIRPAARSAIAMIVSCGFTPGAPGTVLPSMM